jgi:16S rRNA (guanine1207-N2)-methyltransferase
MSHYFLHDENLKSNEYVVRYSFNNVDFHLVSDNGVFSKKRLDEGSYIFIKTLLSFSFLGKVLDLGCGYGAIGLTLKYFFKDKIDLTMSDVNSSCLDLSTKNLASYGLKAKVVNSDGFNNLLDTFDYILFNPPIRIGKEAIYKIYKDAFMHLNPNGHFLIVIRKDKGAESHVKYLETLFSKVTLLERERGYHVYMMIK